MSVSSIGIQTILPKTGTSQSPHSPLEPPANDNAGGNEADEAAVAAAESAAPPPGMGKFIDKTA